jgi:hypothetical protein
MKKELYFCTPCGDSSVHNLEHKHPQHFATFLVNNKLWVELPHEVHSQRDAPTQYTTIT